MLTKNDLIEIKKLFKNERKHTKSEIVALESRVTEKIDVVEQSLSQKIGQLDKKIDVVEQSLSQKIGQLDKKIDVAKQELNQRINERQEDIINTLSDIMGVGYDMHEKRIINLEKHLNIPHSAQ